jgi:transposase
MSKLPDLKQLNEKTKDALIIALSEEIQKLRQQVWVSDLFSAQQIHPAEDWQVCLAHQLRDCQYGIDAGDEVSLPS